MNGRQFLNLPLAMAGLACLFLVLSCGKQITLHSYSDELNLPETPFNYAAQPLPAFFNDQFIKIQWNAPAQNPITDWGATLGRVLFYDTRLSLNQSTSCASCHKQEFGFADTARLSSGFQGGKTKRHSMSLTNAGYYVNGRYFWDERAATLEEQVLHPIVDPVEMGLSMEQLMIRLSASDYYADLFERAFGSAGISPERTAQALAQFVRSMISFRSRYDVGRAMVNDRKDPFPNFTYDENLGKTIFMEHKKVNCSSCHITDAFILDNPRNNGLHAENTDAGIFIHTQQAGDQGKFKSPSLKNVGLRKYFMHDASKQGLQSVIMHYNVGMQANPNLDSHLFDISTQSPAQMDLTLEEINALQAFLLTLTDKEFIHDEKFSSPFKP